MSVRPAPRAGDPQPDNVSLPRVTTVNASNALSGDPKFKKYTQQVDKCLATFDSIHEWADFIAFLTKLLKVRIDQPVVAVLLPTSMPFVSAVFRLSSLSCNSRKSHRSYGSGND